MKWQDVAIAAGGRFARHLGVGLVGIAVDAGLLGGQVADLLLRVLYAL